MNDSRVVPWSGMHSFLTSKSHIKIFSRVVMVMRSTFEFVLELQVGNSCLLCFRLIGDKVYQGEITGREKKNGDKVKEKRNKTSEDNG